MSTQITITFSRNDRELTEFLLKQTGVSRIDELVGTHIRNQLYDLKRMNTQANRNNSLLRACINHLTPSQASGILDEMPEIRERGFPDEWSASEILWSYAED